MAGFKKGSSNFVQQQGQDKDIEIKEEPIEAVDKQEDVDKMRLEDIIFSIGNNITNDETESTSKEPWNEAEIKPEILAEIKPDIHKKNSNHQGRPKQNSQALASLNDQLIGSSANKPPNNQYSQDIFEKWSKGTCVFQCQICTLITGDSVIFWKHVKDEHNIQKETAMFKDKSQCIISNKITCNLCQKEIRFDYKTLITHVNVKHDMKLFDFYQRFYQAEVERKEGLQAVKIENFGIPSENTPSETSTIPEIVENPRQTLNNLDDSSSSIMVTDSKNDQEEDNSPVIYCLCRKPERPNMIGCDHCDEWFHPDCLKLTKADVKELTDCDWTCPKCEIKEEEGM